MTSAIDEMRVIGREISQQTFSGKKLNYKIPIFKNIPTSIETVKESLLATLSQYNDIGLLLSGGKDSRLLACLLKELGLNPTCYSYIGRYSTYEKNEIRVAKKVAQALNFEHKTIELDWQNFYNEDLAYKIMEKTDGVPLFHTLLTMANIRPQIKEKYIITGDLITEFLDTLEYRPWKDGKDPKEILYFREKLVVKTLKDAEIIKKLKQIYNENDLNTLLMLIKSDRLVRAQIYEKFSWNVVHPALDKNVLETTFSLPLDQRVDGKLIRKIVKITNPTLYKMRTARSPFSLRTPLSVHIAYGAIMRTGVNNTTIPGIPNYSNFMSKAETYRKHNYEWWKKLNE